jgi:hypothetical protein
MTKNFDEAAYLQRRAANEAKLTKAGVYGPQMEHDACGVGFVAAQDGKPNRAVVESAIEALQAIWHRGAVDADGMTGDGAGIHIEIHATFLSNISRAPAMMMMVAGWRLAWCFCRVPIWARRNAAAVLSSRKFWLLGIASMAGGRCR